MSCFFAKAAAFVLLGLLRWLELAAVQLALPSPAMAATPLVDAIACNSATGFFVSNEGDLISAAHVLGKCAHAVAITAQGVRFGRRIAVAEGFDIALFRFEGGTPDSAVFPADALDMFWAPVTAVGLRTCGGPDSLRLNEGHAVAGFRQLPDTVSLMADAVILGGNSGSPVVDSAGRVVGMLVARSTANARVGYAVSADRLKAFLSDHGVPIRVQPEPLSSLFAPAGAGTAAVPFTVGVACIM
ncbi:MAG: trypsin-like peptidase domain-containing protein [Rhodospirillales bacterium]|jgi:S1-C subfamily serine protease|nr:trypsin-like peptidase domain-containing protein [Rhodospirillales bacterium]